MYDPGPARWLSDDPILFDFDNLGRYCHNDPINRIDPDGLADYRADFIKAVPETPKDWPIHHVYTQTREILRDRLKNEGIIVDAVENLRAVPPKIHDEITDIQNKFWAGKAKDLETDLAGAYRKVPLKDVEKMNAEITATYSRFWLEAGAKNNAAKVTKIEELIKNPRVMLLKDARKSGVLKKAGIALGAFTILCFIDENLSLAENIIDPPPRVQGALDEVLRQYSYALKEADQGHLSGNRFEFLHSAVNEYLHVAGFDDKVRAVVDANLHFLRQQVAP